MRTLRCSICYRDFTSVIDSRVDVSRGGYIICSRCAMTGIGTEKNKKRVKKLRIKNKDIEEHVKKRLNSTKKHT